MKRKKLRIALIAPISERVPPKKYGGIERVVHALAEELVARGHKVALFASGDSKTSAKLESVYPRALREAKIKDPNGRYEWMLLHITNAYKQQHAFDIIHDHNSILGLPAAQFATVPVVVTIHGAISAHNRRLYETATTPHFVSISKAQTRHAQTLSVAGMVYNGLSMERYPFGETHQGYLLFVGRISLEKGTHHAINAANDAGLPLIIAAKLDEVDKEYFKDFIEPQLSEDIRWIGEISEKERNELMSYAMCLLHPVTWREPFGLTMIEAMACGCPVIAFNKGSIPEIVDNGKTGFVVDDVDDMIDAIGKLGDIDRAECRRYALENFNAQKMADGYEEVYYQVLSKKSPTPKRKKATRKS